MVDMSHHEKEENLKLTHELTEYCHERGIVTEAEPGRMDGGEDGVMDTGDLEGILTTAEEAKRFVDTGIDWLAPAFGNVHGKYGPKGVQLDYDRLDKINQAVGERARLGRLHRARRAGRLSRPQRIRRSYCSPHPRRGAGRPRRVLKACKVDPCTLARDAAPSSGHGEADRTPHLQANA